MKRILICLLLAATLLNFSGCGEGTEELTELWVVTEGSKTDGMNYQAKMIARTFEENHPGITVKLEILPTEEESREAYLHQLRTQIMAGDGPDVYLLPTGSTITTGTPEAVDTITAEPLFPDVQQAMASGLFWDISDYYDTDAELKPEELHPDIMAAGCLGDERYVLPLRFDMTVLMTDEDNWASSGMEKEVLEGDLLSIGWEIVSGDVTRMGAYGLQLPDDLRVLPRVFDYEKGELLVTQEQIAEYMELYQSWKTVSVQQAKSVDTFWSAQMRSEIEERMWELYDFPDNDITAFDRIRNFESYGMYWGANGFPVFTERTEYLVDAILMGKRLRDNVTLRILPDMLGQTHAQVTYYGAVGSSCPEPGLAYEYLREFLSRDWQWDIARPRIKKTTNPLDSEPPEVQCYGQIEGSWPVRVDGAGEYLWENRQYQLFSGSGKRRRQLGTAADNMLFNEDFTVTMGKIDVVEFPFAQAEEETLTYALSLLNDENGEPTDADIERLAQEVYENLWWHLAEG